MFLIHIHQTHYCTVELNMWHFHNKNRKKNGETDDPNNQNTTTKQAKNPWKVIYF